MGAESQVESCLNYSNGWDPSSFQPNLFMVSLCALFFG